MLNETFSVIFKHCDFVSISGTCVLKWEEPFNEAIYCMSHDFNNTLVCGTARHGLVRLWDMRASTPVQMYHVKHPRWGQSSPVYSVAFDPSNLYVALDQSLSLVSFSARKSQNRNNKVVYNYRWKCLENLYQESHCYKTSFFVQIKPIFLFMSTNSWFKSKQNSWKM